MTSTTPKVSVVMITYNHEAYIEQAIQSILAQNCDFDVELIISNDKSTDETDAVIKRLIDNFNIPQHISITYHHQQQNKGMMDNFIWTLNQASGKYIALCEGDDYWTDPLKLQKQVDFLEGNPEYSMCGAQAQCLIVNKDDKEFSGGFLSNNKAKLITADFLSGYPMHTSTVLLRKDMLQLPKWMSNVQNGDVTLFSLLSENGPAHFMNEQVSVYRVTGTGVWSSSSLESRYYAFKNTVNHLNRHFKGAYKKLQYKWEFNEAQKVGQQLLKDQSYWQYVKFVIKNYHRYFWWFIWLPKQKQIINFISTGVQTYWVKFRMFVGLRTRLKKLNSYFLKQL